VSDFAALRAAIDREPHRLVFFAFDLLFLNGQDWRREPRSSPFDASAEPVTALAGISCAVSQFLNTLFLGTMITAIKRAVLFETMADDSNAARRAGGCERMNCAFETVKGVGATIHDHLKGLVVVIAASFASGHWSTPVKVPANRKAHLLA
jgi:hypothetical protein